jgi:hypothetical protein
MKWKFGDDLIAAELNISDIADLLSGRRVKTDVMEVSIDPVELSLIVQSDGAGEVNKKDLFKVISDRM